MRLPLMAALLLLSTAPAAFAPAQAQADLGGRVDKLEKEMKAVQRKVFPGGDNRFFEPEITPAAPQAAPEGIDLVELAAEQGQVESIETLVARNDMSTAVAEVMALLPDEQRTAIILKEDHGMTFQEIADLQGCPLSTVKTRLYQGLSVLRRHLQQQGKYDPARTTVP